MTITEERPGSVSAAGDERAPTVGHGYAEPTGLAGWFATTDHKRIGKLWIGSAVVWLVVGSAVGAIVGAEGVDSGLDVLDSETYGQVYTLHGEVSVFLFLVPIFLGLATALVPLQVGSPDLAFPRGAAAAFWTHLAGAGLLGAAYLANGGPGGGSAVANDLYVLAHIVLNVAICLALVCVLTTVVTMRCRGMTLLRTPLFSWSMLVGGGLTLLTAPVLIARLVDAYVQQHFGGRPFIEYGAIAWLWSVPSVYLLVVPAVGIAMEVVQVLGRSRFHPRVAAVVIIAMSAVFGFGAFAQPLTGRSPGEHLDDLLPVVLGLAGLLPALALLGLVGDTLRRGHPQLKAPLLLAVGAVVHLLLGALAGATEVIEPLELRGTVWESAQLHYSLYGGGALAAFAGLWYWAPKLWGVHLGDLAGKAVWFLTFFGAILLAFPDLVNGLFEDVALRSPDYDEDGLTTALHGVSAVGGVLGVLGVLVAFGDLLGKVGRRRGTPATDDPWDGATLEWATTSPPPPHNFDPPLPTVSSATPLDPVASDQEVVST